MKAEISIDKIIQEMITNNIINPEVSEDVKIQLNLIYGVGFNEGLRYHTNSKPVTQYERNGNFIKSYTSAAEAQRITGIKRKYINRCCNGVQKTAAGYVWKYSKI